MKAILRSPLTFLLLLALAVPAQKRVDERTTTVGMRGKIEQVVLPGSELVAKPVTPDAPLVLRVLATWPHGTDLRYDLEYCGFVPGKHDLAGYLARKDGTPATGLPPLEVEVRPLLPAGQVEPHELLAGAPPRLRGYRALMVVAGILWVLGLVAILCVGRRRQRAALAAASMPVTLADRLRPMVVAAAEGRLDEGGKAELERLLLAYWRRRLGLEQKKVAQAMPVLREHAEAGALLRELEAWLHRPGPRAETDLGRLLEPYRNVAASEAGA